MSEKKRGRILSTLLFIFSILLIVTAAILYLAFASQEKYKDQRHKLYFLSNTTQTQIQQESRYLFPDEEEELPHLLVATLISGPESEQLVSPFPENLRLLDISTQNGRLSVTFSEHYAELDSYTRNLADCCLYQTACSLPDVYEVLLTIEGSETVLLTSDRFITDDRFFSSSQAELTLYTPSGDLLSLQKLQYTHTLYADTMLEEAVLDVLENHVFPMQDYQLLPSPLIHTISVRNHIAYVDLNTDFLVRLAEDDRPATNVTPQNAIYLHAIVASLTELEEINSVRFTFNTQTVTNYGQLDLSRPLTIYSFQN